MKKVDEFLIDIANELEEAIITSKDKDTAERLDFIQAKIMNKIESPWRYDRISDSYIICSQKEWEAREKEETSQQPQ